MSDIGDMLRAATAGQRPLVNFDAMTRNKQYELYDEDADLFRALTDAPSFILFKSLAVQRIEATAQERAMRERRRQAHAELAALDAQAKAGRA